MNDEKRQQDLPKDSATIASFQSTSQSMIHQPGTSSEWSKSPTDWRKENCDSEPDPHTRYF